MGGADKPWIDGLTVGQAFRRSVEKHGDRDAAVFPQLGVRWSFAEYETRAIEVARALISMGIKPGDHVGIWAPNRPEWLLIQYGAAFAGAVLVNLNPAHLSREAAYVIEHADIKALFISDRFGKLDYESMMSEMIGDLGGLSCDAPIENAEFPELRHVISLTETPGLAGIRPWGRFLELAGRTSVEQLAEATKNLSPDQIVSLQYTSGTTGRPKGVMLSHRNILSNAFGIGSRLRPTEDDRLCMPLPLFHCFGCIGGSLASVLMGITLVVPAQWFDPEAVLAAIESERCTAVYGVPTMFAALLHSPNFDKYDLGPLRKCFMGGSTCHPDVCRQVEDRMGMKAMMIGYGQTESSTGIACTPYESTIEARANTVGLALPGVEVRIVELKSCRDVAVGEQGELWARGDNVMLGYYKNPEATAETVDEDGWLHTGDLARQREDGFYQITGRSKEMIIRGGENIYPREIEDLLVSHPKVKQAAVTGLPDEFFGEQICAWIIPLAPGALSEDEVIQFCKENISRQKVPYYVVFVEDYPLTGSGKVRKFMLRDMGIDKFGLQPLVERKTV